MILNDKKIKALIKKIQKKTEKEQSKKPVAQPDEIDLPDESDRLFSEMKKLPYTS